MHDPADFSQALVDAAMLLVDFLKTQNDEAAAVVRAVCDRLMQKERQVKRLQKKLAEARAEREAEKSKLRAQEELQGQSARHWWQIQRLKSQLDFAGYRNSELRRQLWWLKQGLPPELKRKR
jgi:succinate dehydrogenase/fumarate reductase flavoprotein subunit